MTKKTIYSIVDVETCVLAKGDKHGIVFDVAWQNIDKQGNIYNTGSYIAIDVMAKYKPWYYDKMPKYHEYVKQGLILPSCFAYIRDEYNNQVAEFRNKGHNVLFCSYNGRFDTMALGFTSQKLGIGKFLNNPMEFFCIWEAWARNCPKKYTAPLTASKKFYSTTAESVYKFEANMPEFIEEHIAFKDIEIEKFILLKILARKKAIPIVKKISDLAGFIPDLVNKRVPVPCTT